MKLQVKYAKLHAEFFTNGTGNMGTTLDPVGKHSGLRMVLIEEGLYCSYKGVHFFIPPGNIIGVTLFEDPTNSPTVRPVKAA